MKHISFLLFLLSSAFCFSQNEHLDTLKLEFVKTSTSYFDNNSNTYKTRTTESWYFKEGDKPRELVDNWGTNLRSIMKGCSDCNKHLDSLKIYSKKGNNCTLGAISFFIIGAGLSTGGALMVNGNSQDAPSSNIGAALIGGGVASFGGFAYCLIKSRIYHKKKWSGALKRSVTAYNNYLLTWDQE